MMAFHDVQFPLRLAFGASGGPVRAVDIVELANGREVRNTSQSRSRRRYNAVTGVKSVKDARTLSDFFEARSGRLHSFRFRDPLDFSSGADVPTATDQLLGTGDSNQAQFQLVKRYSEVVRPITRPVNDSVTVAVNGSAVAFSLNALGLIDIDAPPTGAVVTAGFLFDVPVRFDADGLVLSLDTHGAVNVTDVPLIEVFEYA
ncbi:MAG: phage distal tail protein, Rcc01695 family [Litorimonas sp.]